VIFITLQIPMGFLHTGGSMSPPSHRHSTCSGAALILGSSVQVCWACTSRYAPSHVCIYCTLPVPNHRSYHCCVLSASVYLSCLLCPSSLPMQMRIFTSILFSKKGCLTKFARIVLTLTHTPCIIPWYPCQSFQTHCDVDGEMTHQ
jgi:hypothetical protein